MAVKVCMLYISYVFPLYLSTEEGSRKWRGATSVCPRELEAQLGGYLYFEVHRLSVNQTVPTLNFVTDFNKNFLSVCLIVLLLNSVFV